MSRHSASKIEIAGFNDLFGQNIEKGESIIDVPLHDLYTFKNHPFNILNDSEMEQLVESIKERGVLVPGIVRIRKEGGYEIVSGHRRKYACELIGKNTMPVIVKELADDEATIAMVDANLQREHLLFSEKAFAYKLKLEAIKHQGSKGDKFTADILGEASNESGRQVQRYIRLTFLIPEILNMVDKKMISFISAVNISYLDDRAQTLLLGAINETYIYPSNKQTVELKKYYDKGHLHSQTIVSILKEKKERDIKVSISNENFKKYFSDKYTKKEVEEIIVQLLEKWKR